MPEVNTAVISSHEPLGDEKVEEAARKSTSSTHNSRSSRCVHSSSGDDDDIDNVEQEERLDRCSTRCSAMGDAPIQPISSVIEIPDVFYDKLPKHRKSRSINRLTNLAVIYSPRIFRWLTRFYSHYPHSYIL